MQQAREERGNVIYGDIMTMPGQMTVTPMPLAAGRRRCSRHEKGGQRYLR
jgi:hypothetical protein